MRKKGIALLLILLLAGLVFVWLSLDRWIENGLESAGEAIVGAKVEIDGFDLDLVNLSAGWQRLQLTDPNNTMQNMVETDKAALKLHSAALLRGRVMIDELTLEGVRSGSPRETDGALPQKESRKKSDDPSILEKVRDRLKKEAANLPVMQFDPQAFQKKLNVDSLVAAANLKTPERLDSVLAETQSAAEKWRAFATDFHPDDRIKAIRDELAGIDVQKMNNLPELISTLEKLKTARESFQSLQKEVQDASVAVQTDLSRLNGYKEAFPLWIDEDLAQIRRMARMPDLSARGIGKQLFGPALLSKIDQVIRYVQIARGLAIRKNESPKKNKPDRTGKTIEFPDRLGWPKFLIRGVSLSGMTNSDKDQPGLLLEGQGQGITSQPRIYGKPTFIRLAGKNEDGRSLQFRALLDHTTEMISDSLELKITNVALADLQFPSNDTGPIRIVKTNAGLAGKAWIGNEKIHMNLRLDLNNLVFDFKGIDPGNRIMVTAQDILKTVNHLQFSVQLSGRPDALGIDVHSNLDNLISDKLNMMVSRTLEASQQKIRAELTRIGNEKVPHVQSALTAFQNESVGPILGYGKQVDDIQSMLNDKIKAAEGKQQGDPTGRLRGLLELIKKKS